MGLKAGDTATWWAIVMKQRLPVLRQLPLAAEARQPHYLHFSLFREEQRVEMLSEKDVSCIEGCKAY